MITLAALTLCMLTLPYATPADPPDPPQCIVVQIDEAGNLATLEHAPTATIWIGDDEGNKKCDVRVVRQAPEVWIGVRVTPIPEALASHLKCSGLMIANVAEDSPADHVGVQRYDVVTSFAGNAIEDMDDLLEAIRQTGPENTVEMVVIRGGKEQALTITPTKRADPSTLSYKYEEPEAPEVDQLKKYFGHRFKIGPQGMGIVLPHGRMHLPEDIEKMLEDVPDVDWEDWAEQWEDWAEVSGPA